MNKTFFPKSFLALSILIVSISVLLLNVIPSEISAQTPDLEDIENEAQKIDQMLMCPVCPAESIDQVQVEVAKQMRVKVREMLSEGRERDEILTYFEQRYGSDILAAPPVRGTMVLAWVIPVVIVGLMILIGLWVIYTMVYRKSDGEI